MKKNQIVSIAAIAILLIVSFTSCSKNDPVPEVDQEEYSTVQIILQHGELVNDKFTASEEKTIINFTKEGIPTPKHVHINEGESYRMTINLLFDGENINQEIIDEADAHQFFFLGAPDGVFDYQYEDANIGLQGILSVLDHTDSAFDFNIILRHGLNKNHAAAQLWNSKTHVQAGGADDLNLKVELHVSESDADHDH
jgi:hypothetical protein